jgi:hypothetical protein
VILVVILDVISPSTYYRLITSKITTKITKPAKSLKLGCSGATPWVRGAVWRSRANDPLRTCGPIGKAERIGPNVGRPFGAWELQAPTPTLKRWAIVNHPYGMMPEIGGSTVERLGYNRPCLWDDAGDQWFIG